MITYIVKTLLCAAALFLIYLLLLEREKMHRFNRFYLLFSILFSLTVSFITIKTPSPVVTVNELVAPAGFSNIVATLNGVEKLSTTDHPSKLTGTVSTASNLKEAQTAVPVKQEIPWIKLFMGLYVAVTFFLFVRFVRNLLTLLFKAARSKKASYHGATLVLTKDNELPHSFLKYIFIDRKKYEEGTIEKEILQHELTHVNQRHSIDILLVELVMVFAWINPLFFLFRKAIMLNHEYLADDAVVNTYHNTESYRLLLFNTVSQTNNLVLSSPFNYLTTKKRLIMMTKNTSRKVALLRQIALIPLIATIGFFLSSRTIAQDKPKQAPKVGVIKFTPPLILPDDKGKPDAPQSVLDEFHSILSAYNIDTAIMRTMHISPSSTQEEIKAYGKLTHMDTLKIKKQDRERLGNLFFQMSHKQQSQQSVQFYERPKLKDKLVPTKAQMESWKDAKTYGIWINSRRVMNTTLNRHPNTDFEYYALRPLDKNTAKIMKYQIEVALTTKEAFENTQNKIAADWKARPDDKYDMLFVMGQKFDKPFVKTLKK